MHSNCGSMRTSWQTSKPQQSTTPILDRKMCHYENSKISCLCVHHIFLCTVNAGLHCTHTQSIANSKTLQLLLVLCLSWNVPQPLQHCATAHHASILMKHFWTVVQVFAKWHEHGDLPMWDNWCTQNSFCCVLPMFWMVSMAQWCTSRHLLFVRVVKVLWAWGNCHGQAITFDWHSFSCIKCLCANKIGNQFCGEHQSESSGTRSHGN